jgi:hypothetical protein
MIGYIFCHDFVCCIAEGDESESREVGWIYLFGDKGQEGRVGGSAHFIFFQGIIKNHIQIKFYCLPKVSEGTGKYSHVVLALSYTSPHGAWDISSSLISFVRELFPCSIMLCGVCAIISFSHISLL